MATVTLERVSKVYPGHTTAVNDVSLSISDGEFVSLVGPSGCGKSTLLNLIAGLDEPSAGSLSIDGRRVNGCSPRERDIAMVFQSYALYPHLSVGRNLAFPLETAKLSRGEINARVSETATLLGLTDLLERRPAALSGGQRQRVALGRALVRRPKVFLFDEPLSNLDAALRTQLRAELKKLHERLGATFIYVTHDQAEAMTLSDRVVVMKAGEVQQIAAPRALYEEPCNSFVAGFFGAPRINLVRPQLLGLTPPRAGLTAAVRPEHLAIEESGSAGVQGKVYLVEPMGAETWVSVDLGEGEIIIVRAASSFARATGEPVVVQVAEHAVRWFDETGRAYESARAASA
jgi:multiple sugar transport system ATP-binding protein